MQPDSQSANGRRLTAVAAVLLAALIGSVGPAVLRRAAAADCVLSECQITVPAGSASVTFDVLGGQGAPSGTSSAFALGGRGARVTATIAANPGDRFVYRAGAAGDNATLGAGGGRASRVWQLDSGGNRTAVIIAGGGGAAGHTAPRGRGGSVVTAARPACPGAPGSGIPT